jgi:hypothetical protein
MKLIIRPSGCSDGGTNIHCSQFRSQTMTRVPKPKSEDPVDDEQGLELPVNPDEGAPLIPDDERVVDVPS